MCNFLQVALKLLLRLILMFLYCKLKSRFLQRTIKHFESKYAYFTFRLTQYKTNFLSTICINKSTWVLAA